MSALTRNENRRGAAVRRPLFNLAGCFLLSCVSVFADGWKQVRAVPAPEAVQAAAAWGDSLYAITGDRVARYDRTSGQQLSVSTGEAHHLNSGFFWDGKLYCAHSNFPEKPERSQIMRLDPANMRLEPFHDFGESDGSLTWAVRSGGRWWCSFAFYGKANTNSYLACYGDDWTELRRWRYPAELIPRLRGASVSGGVWDGDTLLVSGHDACELYRLRLGASAALPATGTLVYVEALPAPFTGQGFAVDPAAGGLVGIDRKRKELLLAEMGGGSAVAAVECQGDFAGHLQGLAVDDSTNIFWSFTTVLVKTDAQGSLLGRVDVPRHYGDLTWHGGKVYVAVNLGKFNEEPGAARSWVYVHDAGSLALLERHAVPEVVHGAGGMEWHDGRFFVVGGLPPKHTANYVYEYTETFSFVRRHVIESGYTTMGIQTVCRGRDGLWWFGCYGKPAVTLCTDDSFALRGSYTFNSSYGIARTETPAAFLIGKNRVVDKRNTGLMSRVIVDAMRARNAAEK